MRFVKMHGIGNDYIYIETFHQTVEDPAELSRRLSDRHFGIGGDGIVLISPSSVADCRMRMFNADGSEAEMCGNAIRCVGKYVFDNGLVQETTVTIETLAGIKTLQLTVEEGKVSKARVDMGVPVLERSLIPMLGPAGKVVNEPLSVEGTTVNVTAVSMGNPHCVTFVPSTQDAPVAAFGPKVEAAPEFPRKTNVEFVQILSRDAIGMRVWERGSGETLACGTGACASAVASALNGFTERKVTVHLAGGNLEIEWAEDGRVYMTGPATEVFTGEFEL